MTNTGRSLLIGLIIFIWFVLLGGCIFLCGEAVSPWWIPLAVCLAISAISGVAAAGVWSRVTGTDSFPLNFSLHLGMLTALLLCVVMLVNRASARADEDMRVKGVVEKVYKQKRNRSRRVGRGRYVHTGEVYYVHKMSLRLPQGEVKNVSLTESQYRMLRKGDTLDLTLRRGALGITLMPRDSIHFPPPRKHSPKQRIRRLGPRHEPS